MRKAERAAVLVVEVVVVEGEGIDYVFLEEVGEVRELTVVVERIHSKF